MTAIAQSPITKKPKPVKKNGQVHLGQEKRNNWTILPLSLVVVACLCLVFFKAYILTDIVEPSVYADAFWFPPIPSFLIAVFGVMYIYKVLRKQYVAKISTAMVYVLFVVAIIFIAGISMMLMQKGQWCTDLSGAITDCAAANAQLLYYFFANPYSLVLLSCIALVGGVALVVKPKSAIE